MPIGFIYSKGDGKMKRWMAFLLAALLLLAAASAAASDVNKAPKFTGGASWDTAVAITEDQCGVLYYSVQPQYERLNDWYMLQPETDGTYYINITNSSADSAIELIDSGMNRIKKMDVKKNNQLIIALSVRAHDKIYLRHTTTAWWSNDPNFYFSVCFDGHHLPGLVSEITAAPTCTELEPGRSPATCAANLLRRRKSPRSATRRANGSKSRKPPAPSSGCWRSCAPSAGKRSPAKKFPRSATTRQK